jgi:hypothetical protein
VVQLNEHLDAGDGERVGFVGEDGTRLRWSICAAIAVS